MPFYSKQRVSIPVHTLEDTSLTGWVLHTVLQNNKVTGSRGLSTQQSGENAHSSESL